MIKRLSALSLKLAATLGVSAFGLVLSPSSARADVVFYEKDGWGVYTRGLVAAHYQLANGDPDPASTYGGVLVGGKLMTTSVDDGCGEMEQAPGMPPGTTRCKATMSLSRIRSGFVGTQLGVGVRRTITPEVKVDSMIAINLADVSSSRNQEINKGVDVREAWASLSGPFGAFKFGRHFMIFGSGSAPVVLISHKYSLGHPCFVDFTTIACGPVGAGAIYADFDAQLRYETPRFVGLQFQIAASDPWVGPAYDITPLPRLDAELNFDQSFGQDIRARVFVEGTYQQLKRRAPGPTNELKEETLVGGFGSAVLDILGFAIGGGGWQCKGCGTRQVAELGIDTANPLFFNNQTFDLRTSRGFFGNAGYTIAGFTVAAGGGAAYVQPTTADAPELMGLPPSNLVSVLHSSTEFHVTATYQWDAVVFGIEYMRWANKWHYGEKQDVNFAGGGANFIW